MRCEVVSVGTELLLGQVVDTNGACIGQQLALAGIDHHYRTTVGDNVERIAAALRGALERADAVVVSGGLGPTPDDVTREALASVLGVELVRDHAMVERIRAMFAARGRPMAESNLRQADLPAGASFIPQRVGTAPGLVCPVGEKVVYTLPGVPHELEEMLERAVLPDLRRRAGARSVIVSRVLRVAGVAESTLAELIADRVEAQSNPTVAFLASGIDGLKVRVTAKAADAAAAAGLLDAEEGELRARLGHLVVGVDDQSLERVVAGLLTDRGLTLGAAESLTGGLVGARLTGVAGASRWFKGSIVSYDSQVKRSLLGVGPGPVVSEGAAVAMATGACRVLGSDVGIAVTGVAGPDTQDGQPVGTVVVASCLDGVSEVARTVLPGDRQRVREYAVVTVLDALRRRLLPPS